MTGAATNAARAVAIAHDFPFDPTYGYRLGDLLAVAPPDVPDNFDAFWRSRYDEALHVEVAPVLGPLETRQNGVSIFGVRFTTVGGLRLGGWLALPDGPMDHGVVVGHGYAGRDTVELPLPIPNAAAIFPCARGLGARSRVSSIPDQPMLHVLHGIETRERYVLGGCAADLWCAASALLQLVPSISGPLGYVGASFGGGVGALALPWDDRFGVAHLSLPSFGQYPLRLTMACTGSGEAVRRYHAAHPEVANVLRYFDAASAATRLEIPVQVAAALFDPTVPPPGQFAVHNALPNTRSLVILAAGHFEHADSASEDRDLLVAQQKFLAAHLG